MGECLICLGECADLFRPSKCTCEYYAHAHCNARTNAVARIGCVYCRWSSRESSVSFPRGHVDNGFEDHDLDFIISFEDRYFVFVGRIVGVTIFGSMMFAAGAVACNLVLHWS
jgi:hypothetical protein